MSSPFVSIRLALLALSCSIVPILPSCRKAPESTESARPKEIPASLKSNGLAGSPSTLLADQADALVHWQPWNRETLANAKTANRLVFAVFAPPQQPESLKVLSAIHNDPALVEDLNHNFVPVLVDSDACRETGILAETLCRDIKIPFSLPLFVWLTPEGNPVAWIPAQAKKSGIRDLFNQSSNMVTRMWEETPSYVLTNSAADNAARSRRLEETARSQPPADNPADATSRGIRQLASLYDGGSRTFDSSGGLFPSGALELLSASLLVPGLTGEAATLAREAADGLARDLSTSAMIDPLDGGIFTARRGSGWQLPRFTRDSANQSRSIVSLTNAYWRSRDPVLLDQILKSIAYAEAQYAAPGGLFALGRQNTVPLDQWLWTTEELGKVLSPEELKVWTAVSDLKNMGNLPIESDPNREHFRKNTLALRTPPEAAAAKLGITPEASRSLFEAGRKKLLKIRSEKFASEQPDPRPHAISTFRMASAYAAAYSVSGDPALKEKAASTLKLAREAFSHGPSLYLFPDTTKPMDAGRAFLYAVALQAGLDVYDITLDPESRSWAEDLASTASERFMNDNLLSENVPEQSIVPVAVSDRIMIFDDSSAGLFSISEARLAKLGYQSPPPFATAVVPLTADAFDRPILHTDALLGSTIRLRGVSVTLAPDASAALKTAVGRLPLRLISRRIALPAETVSPGSAKITFANGSIVSVNTPAEVESAILAGGRHQ